MDLLSYKVKSFKVIKWMRIERFEEIIAWQKGKELSLLVYKLFKHNRDSGFRDQIQRAAVSIVNNIAEGFERQSNKEFKQFLYIAKGSSGEVRSMALLALELSYVDQNNFKRMESLSSETSRLISGFIKTL